MNPQAEQSDDIQLFAKRRRIYPRQVKGRYRRLKWLAMIVTLAIYYLAPLIRWDRAGDAPDQAILIDLPARRAYWFVVEIWPQEIYYIAAILIFAAVALFFITSLMGRVWCGYFCPQTVWTDLFIAVERIVQGDRAARMRLDTAPWTMGKILKKTVTHIGWILISLCTAGAFVFYFNDAPALWRDIAAFDVSPTVMMFVGGLTFSTYLMAGFAREQVCIYMCPYARFQSGMFDRDTLIIGYDSARGEPRGHHKKGESWDGRGHCIDCTACVQVCPTGIDIRNGLQIDCIACGLCVDACNDIMDKVGLPRGLIRYDTENNVVARACGKPQKLNVVRPRSIWYVAILSILGFVVLYNLVMRPMTELHVLHDRNPLFVQLSGGDVRNGYEIRILNKMHEDRIFALDVEGLKNGVLFAAGAGDIDTKRLSVGADSVGSFHVFVKAQPQAESPQEIAFELSDEDGETVARYETMFVSRKGETDE